MPVWQIILLASALLFAAFSVFLWVWNVVRAKKLRQQGFVTTKKTKKVRMPIKLDKFVDIFGGIDNVVSASASNTKIKVYIADHKKVDFNELKKIRNRGIFDQSDSVSVILGGYASDLSGMINDLVTLNTENKKASL
ncbi:PTS transporter subunit EIIB [Spiroplasma platyhelix]|uniref:PTS transporter subunit EIIB n=1 Tax=Spiroplasma platyhelix PALS-1 TaxID=1276218 RepID=A0A846U4F1_9MOLU|nr:PTS transporter subunit EIIB [Spiroplasma platyhelix]MBE4703964.1 hypothetical protein [Spiroplasma platyhelix PALS-1]NKE38337.1 PTS transporter subunit EIIB [Spiroplasma platyhelix PALS-1]UJB29222.1 hypothetical protein SPLAT_v1c04580 [Spiroplasma platyhelix PALS-1]